MSNDVHVVSLCSAHVWEQTLGGDGRDDESTTGISLHDLQMDFGNNREKGIWKGIGEGLGG